MRAALAAVLVLAAAAPAAAQIATPDLLTQQRMQTEMRLNELQAQADMARQREIAAHNDLMALEARLQAEQGVTTARAQAYSPRLPPVNAYQAYAGAPLPAIDTSKLASIPDSALADSNKRVREAAQNRK